MHMTERLARIDSLVSQFVYPAQLLAVLRML